MDGTMPTNPNPFALYLAGDVPVEELDDAQANALVACALGDWVSPEGYIYCGWVMAYDEYIEPYDYCNDWAHAGPLSKQGKISIDYIDDGAGEGVLACVGQVAVLSPRACRAIVNDFLEKWWLEMEETADENN